MNLVKTTLIITFASATRPWLEIREIIRAASGDATQEIQAAPLILDRANQKKRIVFQVRAISHEDELHDLIEQAKKEAANVMVGINDASTFPDMTRMRLETVSIEPVETPFHELVASLKGKFLQPTRVGNIASDLAIVFDRAEGAVQKTVHIGPMDKEQLQTQVLRWPAKVLPSTCIYVGLHYQKTESVPFSRGVLESFLDDAINWQSSEAVILASE